MMEGLEDAMLPMPSNCIKTAPDSFTCALCNATYGNMVSFRQHTKFHEDERDREQRNLMLNNMVSMCYSKSDRLLIDELLSMIDAAGKWITKRT